MKRYLFISFSYSNNKGISGFGNISYESDGFPNIDTITKYCEGAIEFKQPKLLDEKKVVILSINELSESDYKSLNFKSDTQN
jgi:hypothetical protein